ncbi:NVEALA domain-containing protein [Proteiniphilum propionicum]|jgi:hypothetical protein|uniref:NVEALA domain-containing protein n=1 Tax=Proteiniphilum propionicum TaxID=2829812 RepID=UPI001EEADC4C|nr:NVEALA domain-containing protein [Proteiniphilum propionicum]ULB35533.1 hypothetical protein KDN43_05720 [Proteiniphilum propionicum]
MKKKILSGLFALALLATAGFGVNKSLKSNANLSDLALSNVEALANGESGGSTFYCCGNTCTCAKGTDQNGNEFVIHGHLHTSPCQ